MRPFGQPEVVRDKDHGCAGVIMQFFHEGHHIRTGTLVQVAGRLIGKKDPGLVHKGPGKCHALLLPARQLGGIVIKPITQADSGQERFRSLRRLGSPGFPQQLQRDPDVLKCGERGHQMKGLKDETHGLGPERGSIVFVQSKDVGASQTDGTCGRFVQPGQEPQQRSLSASGGSKDCDNPFGLDAQVDILEHFQRAAPAGVCLSQSLGFNHMRQVRLNFLVIAVSLASACGGPEESGEIPQRSNPAVASPTTTEPHGGATGSLPRVVMLGTSLTEGLGLPDSQAQAWPALIADMADSAGYAVEVVNAGVSGDTSAGGLRRLDWLLQNPVALMIVELGANDGLRGLPVAQMEANLDSILARTAARYPEARLAVVPMEAPRNLGQRYVDEFSSVFPRVAERHGALLLTFILDGIAGVPDLNQSDGIHPTIAGHQIMARTIWPGIEPVLSEIGGGSQ